MTLHLSRPGDLAVVYVNCRYSGGSGHSRPWEFIHTRHRNTPRPPYGERSAARPTSGEKPGVDKRPR
jgi:hypothetical protein